MEDVPSFRLCEKMHKKGEKGQVIGDSYKDFGPRFTDDVTVESEKKL